MFRHDLNFRSNQERRVKSDTELSNQVELTCLQVLQKLRRTRFGDRTKIIYKLIFGHADTIVDNFNNFSVLIVLYLDL